MNSQIIEEVKRCIEEVMSLNDIEEKSLRQRVKIERLRIGDGNNAFFHSSIKAKQNAKCLNYLQKYDGSIITTHHEIEKEVLEFYSQLMGKQDNNLKHIDIKAMRIENQLNMEQRENLIRSVSKQEIIKALKCMGDLKAPGIDGYGARLFKSSWPIIKEDVIAAMK
ncbi:unnamed protein product [Lathyrus sativus]|nr:unnamed protein product [Lathyrus sativus]